MHLCLLFLLPNQNIERFIFVSINILLFLLIVRIYKPEMLQDLENNFSELEKKILLLQKNYKNLTEKFSELSIEHEELKKKYDEERKKSQVLAEEQKNIKLYSAISGNPEHNRLMKNHINRLVKEIDFCIAQLQNSGL
jgi:Skp family chaperone for outer membrane proteins